MTSLTLAWTESRAKRAARPKRTPLLILFITWLARTLPSWRGARTAVMQTTGAGAIVFGLFQWSTIAGCIGAGVALFVLEALGGQA